MEFFGLVYVLFQVMGFVYAYKAIMYSRTSQGSIAWSVGLVVFPFIAVPLYLFFGSRKFLGYVEARREGTHAISQLGRGVQELLEKNQSQTKDKNKFFSQLAPLAMLPVVKGNKVELLINGRETFNRIFDSLSKARETILLQFYIVRDDQLGRELKDRLIERAKAGVRVLFIYDEIGSYGLSRQYINDLREAGVDVRPFATTLGPRAWKFQINFRNHRKIVCIDGEVAFVGGHNVGDEYLRDEAGNNWRDAHVKIEGPAVKAVQLSFVEDWHWVSGEIPNLLWENISTPGGIEMLCLPTGPSDFFENCELMFVAAINQAKERIWITSPYFVPDRSVISALILAVVRGVDVRIILPEKYDTLLIELASQNYIDECIRYGVKIYAYQEGFMHQKLMLIDNDLSIVGTANFDNRSFHLNFEISCILSSRKFNDQVEKVFKEDLEKSRVLAPEEFDNKRWYQLFIYRLASLFSPLL